MLLVVYMLIVLLFALDFVLVLVVCLGGLFSMLRWCVIWFGDCVFAA